jgi:hypothetical protein
MTISDAIAAFTGSNIGAHMALMSMMQKAAEMDPQGKGIGLLFDLDTYHLYDEDFWIFHAYIATGNDRSKCDPVRTLCLLEAVGIGMEIVSPKELRNAIARFKQDERVILDADAIIEKVLAQKPQLRKHLQPAEPCST